MSVLSQMQARSAPRLCFRLLAPARRIALDPRPSPTCSSLNHRLLLPGVFPTMHHQPQYLASLHLSVLHQQRLPLRLSDFSFENQEHRPEGLPVVRQHVLMSQWRSFRQLPERGSQKRTLLKFIIKMITKVIVLLFRLIGSFLEVFGLEVGTAFEKLKIFHEYLKASDELMGKAYRYVLNYLSKKFDEIVELLMDITTGKAAKFAQKFKIFQKLFGMWKKVQVRFGLGGANSKEEKANNKKEEAKANSKEEEVTNSAKEKKEEELFTKEKKEEQGKELNKEEKNANKKGRILIELYDIEKIDDILKSEVWQTIKSSNVGAVKVEKKD